MKKPINEFINELSSKAPVPGGGGASALIGAIGVSLCSMVANLTFNKEKCTQYREDMEAILERTEHSVSCLLDMIQRDAEAFEPLSVVYSMPIDEPGREKILEEALITAAAVPFEMLQEVANIIDVMDELMEKGTKLAISDVGVAASACRSAMEGAVMNVYINTKLMYNKEYALSLNEKADAILKEGTLQLDRIYQQILRELRCI